MINGFTTFSFSRDKIQKQFLLLQKSFIRVQHRYMMGPVKLLWKNFFEKITNFSSFFFSLGCYPFLLNSSIIDVSQGPKYSPGRHTSFNVCKTSIQRWRRRNNVLQTLERRRVSSGDLCGGHILKSFQKNKKQKKVFQEKFL